MSDIIKIDIEEPIYINLDLTPANVVLGPQGEKGDDGEQGLQGIQGLQGLQGIQGLQGPIGSLDEEILLNQDEIGIEFNAINNTVNQYQPFVFKTNIINANGVNDGHPDFKFKINAWDINEHTSVGGVSVRWGFNPGVTPPAGQISLEDLSEYYYNLDQSNPPDIVAERHWEFRPTPESGAPTQRWLTFAGRFDGSKTIFNYVGDVVRNQRANGDVALEIDHFTNPGYSRFFSVNRLQFTSAIETIIENNLKVSGLGNIYNDNGNELNFGNSTNKNQSIFYGITGSGGLVQRLKNDNSTTGWALKINTFPSLQFVDEQTGAAVLALFNGAPNNSIVVRASGNIGLGGMGNPVHPITHDNGAHLTAAGAWVNASDIAYKNKIKPTKYGLDEILKLNPVEYIHKASGLKQVGLIAQELEKIMPEFVTGEEGNKGINYGQIVSVLINAIKQLNDRN